MKVSILGGCGFIGAPLAGAFADAGHQVTVLDRPGANRDALARCAGSAEFFAGDFASAIDVARVIEGAEVVVHLVSSTRPGSGGADPIHDLETNVSGTARLLESCVGAGVRKVVFVSSGGTVYGVAKSLPIAESHPLDPISSYGLSKVMIEKMLGLYHHHHHGLDYTVLRVANPYGAGQQPGTGQGVIAEWLNSVRRGLPVQVWGDGSVVRDYVYIDDVVRALVLAAGEATPEKVFNVGTGVGHSLLEIHALLEDVTSRAIPIEFRDARAVDAPANVLEVSLAAEHLGWRPQTSLKDGLALLWRSTAQ